MLNKIIKKGSYIAEDECAIVFKPDNTIHVLIPDTQANNEDLVSSHFLYCTAIAFLDNERDEEFDNIIFKAIKKITNKIDEQIKEEENKINRLTEDE